MYASEISEAVIVDVIQTLLNPSSAFPPSDGARSLISPSLELDFELLRPPKPTADGERVPLSRHSHSAQALALFRLPSVVVNHVPGASWTLEVTSVVKDESLHMPPLQWRAQLEWTLQAGVRVPLVGGTFLKTKTTREIVLEFGPKVEKTSGSDEEERREREREARVTSIDIDDEEDSPMASSLLTHSIEGSSHSIFDDGAGFGELEATVEAEVVLLRASYSGIGAPEALRKMTGYATVSKVAPQAANLCLAPAYGLLLLLGLDASTRSLAPSAAGRHKLKAREERRRLSSRAKSIAHKGKAAHSHSRALERTSSIGSEDSTSSDLDPHWDLGAPESRYHQAMRLLHVRFGQLAEMQSTAAALPVRAGEEMSDLFAGIRHVVLWIVELMMNIMGVKVKWTDLPHSAQGEKIAAVEIEDELGRDSLIKSSTSASPRHAHVKRVSFASSPSRSLPTSPSRTSFGPIGPTKSFEYESPSRKTVNDFFAPARVQPKSRESSETSSVGGRPPATRIHHKKSSVDLNTRFKRDDLRVTVEADAPTDVDKDHLNDVLGELTRHKRRASIAGQDVDALLIPRQTSNLDQRAPEDVQKHKRELSELIHALSEAELEHSTAQAADDSPSILPGILPSTVKQNHGSARTDVQADFIVEKDDKSETVHVEDVEREVTDTEVEVETDAEADEQPIAVEPTPLDERPAGSFPAPALDGHASSTSASSHESALDVPRVAAQANAPSESTELGTGARDEQQFGLLTDQPPVIPQFDHLSRSSPLGLQSDEAEAEADAIAESVEQRVAQAPAADVEFGIRGLMSPTLSAGRAAQFEELLKNAGIASPSLGSGGGVSVTSATATSGAMGLPAGYVPPRKWWEGEDGDGQGLGAGAGSQAMQRESSGSSWSSQGYNSPMPDLRRTWSAGTPGAQEGVPTQSSLPAEPNEQTAASCREESEAKLERDIAESVDPAIAGLFRGDETTNESTVEGKAGELGLGVNVDVERFDFAQPRAEDRVKREKEEEETSFLPFNQGPGLLPAKRSAREPSKAEVKEEDDDELPPLEELASPAQSESTLAATTPGTTPASSPVRSNKSSTPSPVKSKGNHREKAVIAALSSSATSPKASPAKLHTGNLSHAHEGEENTAGTSASASPSKSPQKSPPKHNKKKKGGRKKGSVF